MRKLFFLCFLLLLVSCKQENALPGDSGFSRQTPVLSDSVPRSSATRLPEETGNVEEAKDQQSNGAPQEN